MQFKKGDIICSDKFRSGLLLFVEEYGKYIPEDNMFYVCTSLLDPKQTWYAYEHYNFRVATDEDIARELSIRVKDSELISSDLTVDIGDEYIILDDGYYIITLTPNEAIKLRNIINTYVEG